MNLVLSNLETWNSVEKEEIDKIPVETRRNRGMWTQWSGQNFSVRIITFNTTNCLYLLNL